jgi:two-component system, sensor histidine kinase
MTDHLSISTDHYQLLFESSPASFLILLPDADFTIAAVTEDYLRDTLTERENIVGRPIFDVFPDNPAAPESHSTRLLAASFQRVIATKSVDTMALIRYDLPKPDGTGFEERYWRPVNKAALSPEGEILYIIHRAQDVTDFVRLLAENKAHERERADLTAQKMIMEQEVEYRSRELAAKNTELKYANDVLKQYTDQMRDEAHRKDEFLAMLAHELRNPLAGISTALQLMEILGNDAAKVARPREICRRQIGNLTRLVDDLLDVSRVSRGTVDLRKEPMDLRDIVDSTLHAMRGLFDARGLIVSINIAPGNYRMEGDRTRLEQVLTNLLGNAAKYSDDGCRIDITLESEIIENAQWAVLKIKDAGRGIPVDQLSAIFDLFVQVDTTIDRARGGLGIGLTLVKKLIELHEGAILAESQGLGCGSIFTVRLPLNPLASLPSNLVRNSISPLTQSLGTQVLIIEDNADTRESLKSLLEAYGYAVEVAVDGENGLQRLLQLRPDAAIVDIGLPGLNGFEVARRVRQSFKSSVVKLIALSGYSDRATEGKAIKAGFDVYLVKPINVDDLTKIIKLGSHL